MADDRLVSQHLKHRAVLIFASKIASGGHFGHRGDCRYANFAHVVDEEAPEAAKGRRVVVEASGN